MSSPSNTRPMAASRLKPQARLLGWLIMATFLGLVWIWRSGRYEHYSSRYLSLERQHQQLLDEAGQIRRDLLKHSQLARVEALARQRLGMVWPEVPPDTIWTETHHEAPLMGVVGALPSVKRLLQAALTRG
ncbi:MAG: hypothetical protein FJY67_06965 [Calditrichaeota bacterium]|nr:hypothetical protein [Calditrichota bacterium]